MIVRISLVYSLFTLFEYIYIYESGNYTYKMALRPRLHSYCIFFNSITQYFTIEHAHYMHRIIGLLGNIGNLYSKIYNV